MQAKTIVLNSKANNQQLHLALLQVGGKRILVDAGYPDTVDELVKRLERENCPIRDLNYVIVSHDDLDHVGGLYFLKQMNPSLQVLCSRGEEPSLTGKVKSERLQQAERLFDSLPYEHRPWALQFQHQLENIQRVPIDRILSDNELFEKEIQIVNTPGHTRGHISLYIPAQGLLIANDAFVIENNGFEIANPTFTLDMDAALQSVEKLYCLDVAKVICYHGGEWIGDVHQELGKLLARYGKSLPKSITAPAR